MWLFWGLSPLLRVFSKICSLGIARTLVSQLCAVSDSPINPQLLGGCCLSHYLESPPTDILACDQRLPVQISALGAETAFLSSCAPFISLPGKLQLPLQTLAPVSCGAAKWGCCALSPTTPCLSLESTSKAEMPGKTARIPGWLWSLFPASRLSQESEPCTVCCLTSGKGFCHIFCLGLILLMWKDEFGTSYTVVTGYHSPLSVSFYFKVSLLWASLLLCKSHFPSLGNISLFIFFDHFFLCFWCFLISFSVSFPSKWKLTPVICFANIYHLVIWHLISLMLYFATEIRVLVSI